MSTHSNPGRTSIYAITLICAMIIPKGSCSLALSFFPCFKFMKVKLFIKLEQIFSCHTPLQPLIWIMLPIISLFLYN